MNEIHKLQSARALTTVTSLQLRCMFYMIQIMSEDIHAQKHGILWYVHCDRNKLLRTMIVMPQFFLALQPEQHQII